MIVYYGFTVACDVSGQVFPGSYPTYTAALTAALVAGWMQIGKLVVSPTIAATMPTTANVLNTLNTANPAPVIATPAIKQ